MTSVVQTFSLYHLDHKCLQFQHKMLNIGPGLGSILCVMWKIMLLLKSDLQCGQTKIYTFSRQI